MRSLGFVVLVVAVFLSVLLPSGAGWAAPPDQSKRSLVLAIDNDEGLLTPMNWNTWVGYYVTGYIYDTLLDRDLKNVPIPGVAKAWSVSDDGLTWKLTLRDDVKWHDGRKLTAEDVVFNFDALKKRRPGQVANVASVTAEGESAVTIVLAKVTPFFAADVLMDMQLVPKHVWQDVEIKNERTPFAGRIGSGPFKLQEMKVSEYYNLAANPDYWGGRPQVDELTFKVIKDRPAQFQALKVGEVDAVMVSIPAALVGELEKAEGIKLAQGADFFNYVLDLNLERPLFERTDVRRAVSLAIDKAKLVELALQGRGSVLPPSYYHPALPYSRKDLKAEFDVAKAKALLDALGVKDTNGDGLRELEGKPLDYTLLCDSNNPTEVRTAEMLRTMLKEIGVGVTLRCMDVDTVMSFVWPKYNAKNGRNYDMSIFAWSAAPLVQRPFVRGMVHSDIQTVGWANVTAYKNSAMDKLVDELVATASPARQDTLQKDIGGLIAEDVPFIPLFSPDGNFAYRQASYDRWAYVQGVGILPRMSFLPGYGTGASGAPGSSPDSQQTVPLLAGIAVVIVALVALARLRFGRSRQRDGK